MVDNPLKLGGGFGGLTGCEVRQSSNVDGIQATETPDEADTTKREGDSGNHRSARCRGGVAHRQRQPRAHPVRAARVDRDRDGQCCHERVEPARRRPESCSRVTKTSD